MALHTLAYVSQATEVMAEQALRSLLDHARTHNLQYGITGFLIYCHGSFFQVVEGEQQVLDRLYNNLLGDDRHRDLRRLYYRALARRDFAEWSMAFREYSDPANVPVPGFSALLTTGALPVAGASEVGQMIQMFRKLFDAA